MTRFLGRRVQRVTPWLVGALALGSLATAACNYRWVAVLSTFQFNRMEVVSVFPAHRDENGAYERQCTPDDGSGRNVNSLLISLNLVGTEVGTGANPDEKDNDTSIRPGDLVKKGANQRSAVTEGVTLTEAQFRVDLECFEPYPDPDLIGDADCQGVNGPRDATPQKLNYRSHYADEFRPSPADRDAMAVAVLVDQSGSMKGFVETATGQEVIGGSSGPWDPVNFKNYASDPDGHRLAAIRSFYGLLNPNDRAAVFQFGESVGSTAAIVCDKDYGETEELRRQNCFGTNRKVTTSSKAFNGLLTGPKGRTPLWAAVADVYGFLKANASSRVRHLLVVTDGPDTCHPSSPDFQPTLRTLKNNKYVEFKQDTSCSEVSFDDFLTAVEADLKDADGNWLSPNQVPVHVSFIQFQAKGYAARDPRQQEIACRTGGHFIFINAQDLEAGEGGDSPLRDALLMAVQRIRGALAGAWTVAVDVADLANDRLAIGAEVAVEGTVQLLDNNLTPPASYNMRVGYVDSTAAGRNIPRLDMRSAIRVPCASGDSCAWYSGLTSCQQVGCRGGDKVCAVDQKPDATTCDTDGACCWGGCVTPAECKTVDALCNQVNAADLTTCSSGVCCKGVCTAGAACP